MDAFSSRVRVLDETDERVRRDADGIDRHRSPARNRQEAESANPHTQRRHTVLGAARGEERRLHRCARAIHRGPRRLARPLFLHAVAAINQDWPGTELREQMQIVNEEAYLPKEEPPKPPAPGQTPAASTLKKAQSGRTVSRKPTSSTVRKRSTARTASGRPTARRVPSTARSKIGRQRGGEVGAPALS